MLNFLIPKKPDFILSCCLKETSFTLAAIKDNKQLLFTHHQVLNEPTSPPLAKALADEIDRRDLIGYPCHLTLAPGQYQLILMDVPEQSTNTQEKSLRANLKGLSEYPLDDVLIDAFPAPKTKGEHQKKTFVALTPASKLQTNLAVCSSAFLNVVEVGIPEIAIKNFLSLIPTNKAQEKTPLIFITLNTNTCKLHLFYQNNIYFVRDLIRTPSLVEDEMADIENMIHEIERSVDYCVSQLQLPEPSRLFLAPGFQLKENYIQQFKEKFKFETNLFDFNQYLEMEQPMSIEDQQTNFYTILGATQVITHTVEAVS